MLDVAELAVRLCEIPSTTGEEAAVVSAVEGACRTLGLEVMRQPVGDVPGRDNLLALVPGTPPELLFTTHLDTVPPHIPPRREGEWIWGRGTCDAKGIAAAMIAATERLLAEGERRAGLLFVVGEETSSDGARKAPQGFAPKVRWFIDGEPTEGKLVAAMKGAVVFDLFVEGKAGHSAYPERGYSAVHHRARDVVRLVEEPWPEDPGLGATTLNVGTFEGGVAANVIAPSASARCIMRTTTDPDALVARIREIVDDKTRVEVRSTFAPLRLHVEGGFETSVVAFASDIPYLLPLGTPLLYGPGSIHDAHTDHERVRVRDLEAAVGDYVSLARALLARGRDDSRGKR